MVALGSVRSCGVTTLALALAATWPKDRPVLLVEADPAGGTLAAASGWPPEPSLVSLAAAARHALDPDLVWEHCQELPGGAAVLTGPASADQARSALGMLAGLSNDLGMLDTDVLVDCGRLDPGAPGAGAFEGADAVVLAARPRLADLHALATWREANPFDSGRVAVVLVLPDTSNDDGIDVDGEDGFMITSSLVTFKVITQFLTMSFSSPSSLMRCASP